MTLAAEAIDALRTAGATVATAESLTGGLVCASLVDVPGASDVVRGGVVAYAADVKIGLLGVDASLIAENGTVDAGVAEQMALGACRVTSSTYGLATTGVAGPDASEGKPPGTVHVAIAGPGGVRSTLLNLVGDRDTIRRLTVDALLSELVARLGEESRSARG
ncbi:CinA family protein [Aeromicrobium sp.]|uniref:CinA family protein n=1 Tax=Aeromicrobium sp. TaxID=1871063 RepID=UPI0019866A31|nr:nicotinamide-nucleotide amidohydrolase family protein [Aeromicrobium sp.]MBC7631127.1 nicotinamide-nucleotide amidohydrolase family protein [Aeromicrobium sp.]